MQTLKEVLKLHSKAVKTSLPHITFTCNNLIHLYSNHGLLTDSLKLFHEIKFPNIYSWNTIISAHIRNHRIPQAHLLFISAQEKDTVTYNTMLSAYTSSQFYHAYALRLFSKMQSFLPPDHFTLTTMLNLAASMADLSHGTQLHCFMLKSAFHFNLFAVTSLVDMYSKCHRFHDSFMVFSGGEGPVGDVVSRNAMVAACCREGDMETAEEIFMDHVENGDVVFWNTMISGFQTNGYAGEALKLFVLMLEKRVGFNEYTLVGVLSGCRDLGLFGVGKEVHGMILRCGFMSNRFIRSCLIDFYCKCKKMRYAEYAYVEGGGDSSMDSYSVSVMISGYSGEGEIEKARRIFDSFEEKNSVVWTALFSGYVKCNMCASVFDLFSEYISSGSGVVFDSPIMISLFTACSSLACLGRVKQIHSFMFRNGVEMGKKVVSSMVDSYSKCGSLIYAERIFTRIVEKDVVIYNIMIASYGVHGNEMKAVRLFEEMREGCIWPDASTFVAVLSACRHCGLIETGERYFGYMVKEYNILPEIDHFSCMVDMYGRARKLDRAVEAMGRVSVAPDTAIWGAILNNCCVEVVKAAEEKIVGVSGGNADRLVQIANVYAAEGRWDEVGRVRMMIRGKGVRKVSGCSWVYVGDRIHVFRSGDVVHPEIEAVYTMVLYMAMEMDFRIRS